MNSSNGQSQDESLILQLREIVLDNLDNKQFSVEKLSAEVGISRSQLHRKLKRIKGQSTSQFIRGVKLNEAMKLLQEDAATISEIAYRVGFNSPSYFHKCFLKEYGCPPGDVKKGAVAAAVAHTIPLTPTLQKATRARTKLQLGLILSISIGFILALTAIFALIF